LKKKCFFYKKLQSGLSDDYSLSIVWHFFLFSKSQIDTIPWDSIRNNYLILRRYDLSNGDLVDGGWNVTYP